MPHKAWHYLMALLPDGLLNGQWPLIYLTQIGHYVSQFLQAHQSGKRY